MSCWPNTRWADVLVTYSVSFLGRCLHVYYIQWPHSLTNVQPLSFFVSFSLRISCCWTRTSPTPGSSWSILGSLIRLKREMSSRTFLEHQSLLVRSCFSPLISQRENVCWCVPTLASKLNLVSGWWVRFRSPHLLWIKVLIPLCFTAPEIVNYEPLGLEADMW